MTVKVNTLKEVKELYKEFGGQIMGKKFSVLLPNRLNRLTAVINFSRGKPDTNVSEDLIADVACDISPELNPRMAKLNEEVQQRGLQLHRRLYSWN